MNKARRIMIVEDEPKLSSLLHDYLIAAGYETEIHAEGSKVVESVKNSPPDMMLLDLMLPGKDGLSICREVRAFSTIPIIMLTARVEEIDRLLGLDLGADDYICKPFSPREVVARVKAILRRVGPEAGGAAPIELDQDRFTATLSGKSLGLTPVEFRLLTTLAAQPGRVFSRNQLMDILYVDHRIVSDRTVDSHVKNLRRKITDADGSEEWLQSIYGVGYKIEW
ncbi:MAG: response regulator [Betaproteobacteria bacterium]